MYTYVYWHAHSNKQTVKYAPKIAMVTYSLRLAFHEDQLDNANVNPSNDENRDQDIYSSGNN